ncbi:MAG TPA: xanthine dehydrogenase family protein molybdopterin-binding subunit [Xanthobacteraceae bacterium]|nr:xanthine dehydrogenase family protein molybdopterin-binding subunit [Xanthobacteraceae bacterium]
MITKRMMEKALAPTSTTASRRQFLKGSAATAGALVVATTIDFGATPARALTLKDPPQPNAFIRIAPDNTVTVLNKHLDMGQGNATGLTTIVAEELDADWSQMRSEFAPANPLLYNNFVMGPIQGTGGSTAIANSWQQLREAGAAARVMLIAAAADSWGVPEKEITIAKGVISHAKSGKSGKFGEFAAKAANVMPPITVQPKDPKDWVHIGKRIPRLDSVGKTTGKTIYAMDMKRPGMLTAMVEHPPRFGGKVKSFDASEAKKIAGVVDVFEIPQGVAVLAKDTWSAMKGRAALKVEWDDSAAEQRSSEPIFAEYRKLAATPGTPAARRGDAEAALKAAAKVVEGEFTFPYLAHAPMEPLNAVIEVKDDGSVEVWAGAQFQTIETATVAWVLGVLPTKVTLHTLWAGGSFGRRATPNADYIGELAEVAKASKAKTPIHLVWSRKDDIRGGRYRPMFVHSVRAGLDADGKLVAWQQRLVGQSFMVGTLLESAVVQNGIDETAVEGAADLPYAIPNFAVDWHHVKSPVTTLWWRSVGHTHTAQATEVMIDQLAHAAGKDPLAFRLDLLKEHPRHAAVLKLAAEKANYGEALAAGRGRGIAVHESFNSFVAMVADVTVGGDGGFKVDKVVAAVDCGVAVNPDVIRAQVEGGIGFGLGAALRNQITLANGVVEQSNFDGYRPIRISDMPEVEVHIVPSLESPTGIGEPGVPPVAPAVTNAIFNATGKRLYSLPWQLETLRGV